MEAMESKGPSRWYRKCGLRSSSTWLRTMSHRNRLPNSLTQVMMIDALACTLEQFLSGGRSENTCLKPWGGRPEKEKAAQDALLVRAKADSLAQRRK
ncbi:unnamed protein product [Musa hybrid cultivar]